MGTFLRGTPFLTGENGRFLLLRRPKYIIESSVLNFLTCALSRKIGMRFFKISIAVLIIISSVYPASASLKEPNILLITIDTLRYDRVGAYSDKHVNTHHMNELASQSWVFDWAFAHNPVTLPSHTNILTGVTPVYHGISDNPGFVLADGFLTLAEFLKEKEYSTGAFIASFPLDSRFGLNQGFDVYDDNYGTQSILDFYFIERPAEEVIKPAMEWISGQKQKWFAWIHVFDPHEPYSPPSPYDMIYSDDLYSGEVAYVDSQLGILFDFLEKNDSMKNTIIILTSDHGEALGEKGERTHSYFAYNNTIHVPLIIWIPGESPKRVAENVCHLDIFPTVCDLINESIPAHIQGESLVSIAHGKKRVKKEIYFESLTPFLNRGWAPLTGFIRDDIKFINQPLPEIYNMKLDLSEDKNLANSSNVKGFENQLDKLVRNLRGKEIAKRFEKIDVYEMNKLKSLGYLTSESTPRKKAFTKNNDLKMLKPVQNKMYDAVNKYKNGKTEEAIHDLTQVIESRPDFVLAYKHLASIYYAMDQIDPTVDTLRKGLKNNPNNLGIMSKLGIMLVVANKKEEAIDLLQKCIKKDNQNPEYYNYLGVAFQKSGDFQSALTNYKKAIELDGNFALPWSNMGSLYLVAFLKNKNERDYQRAIDNFNTALAFDPALQAAINGKNAAYKFKEQVKK